VGDLSRAAARIKTSTATSATFGGRRLSRIPNASPHSRPHRHHFSLGDGIDAARFHHRSAHYYWRYVLSRMCFPGRFQSILRSIERYVANGDALSNLHRRRAPGFNGNLILRMSRLKMKGGSFQNYLEIRINPRVKG